MKGHELLLTEAESAIFILEMWTPTYIWDCMDQCTLEVESIQTPSIHVFPYEAELFHVAVLKVDFNRLIHREHKTYNRLGITSRFETALIVYTTRICHFLIFSFCVSEGNPLLRADPNIVHGIQTCIPRVTDLTPERSVSVVVDRETANFHSSFCTKLLSSTRASPTYTC